MSVSRAAHRTRVLLAGLAMALLAPLAGALGSGATASASAFTSPLTFVSPSSVTAYVGHRFAFHPLAEHTAGPQGGSIFYYLAETNVPFPTWATWNQPSFTITGTPKRHDVGTYQVFINASDPGYWPVTGTVTITVTDARPPAGGTSVATPVVPSYAIDAPPAASYATNSDKASLGNVQLDDCLVTAEVHLGDDQAAAVGRQLAVPSIKTVYQDYINLTGGSGGTTVRQGFAQWRGGVGGTQLYASGRLADPRDAGTLRSAVWQLGGVLAVVRIPLALTPGATWVADSADTRSGTVGLHAVAVVGYDPAGPVVSTWGALQQVSWRWWSATVVNVYPVVTTALARAERGPSGVPLSQLLARWTR